MTNEEIEKQLAHHRELIEGLNERIENLESTKNVINSLKLYELNNLVRNLKILLDAKNTKEHD